MTEDEAKTKWCPFARASGYGGANRFIHDDTAKGTNNITPCVASACMAWRVITRTEVRHRDGHVVRTGEVYLRGNTTEHHVSDGGYCGLAGAPT